jgi:acyl-CoA thioester hydrolase
VTPEHDPAPAAGATRTAPVNTLFVHRLEVRFRDCDAMGHVNNAVYLTYLEETRFHHWRATDLGPRVPGIILARVEIDYRRPAKFGETIEIRLGVAAVGRTSFTYEYEIVGADAQLIASAKTVLVSFDYEAGRPVPIPQELRAVLGAGC